MRQVVEEGFEVGEEWGDFDKAVKEHARHFLTFPWSRLCLRAPKPSIFFIEELYHMVSGLLMRLQQEIISKEFNLLVAVLVT
jgi:hypothetical protein